MYLRGLGSITVIPRVDWTTCKNMNGAFASDNPAKFAQGYGEGFASGTCTVITPETVSPTPANITVNTATNTQVSPQISPNLIQQQQPTNSPVSAGTVSSPTDRMIASPVTNAPEPLKTAPAPTPSPAMQTTTEYIPGPSMPEVQTPTVAPENFFVKNAPYEMIGIAILAGLGMMALSRRGK